MFDFEEELKKLPASPGVYLMRDYRDQIIYVGKAISLRNRVRSYFRESTTKSSKIQKMVSLITRFEYIITDSELEALVLENNLIKEHNPRYNTMLKDDKTYPYIKVTIQDEYPRIFVTREMKKDRAKYFGPYTDVQAVRETIDLINSIFMLRTCNRNLPRDIGKERACLNYHIKQCTAPCQGYVTMEQYQKQVEEALDFLNGNYQGVIKGLEEKMKHASEQMEFEEAIQYREQIQNIKKVTQKQKITDYNSEDKDVIGLCADDEDAVVQVFFIRNGKLIGREHFHMTRVSEESTGLILNSFIKQFYAGTPYIPKELMIQEVIEEAELVEQWLSTRRGSKVSIRVPQKGGKEKLVDLARRNAELVLKSDKERLKREEGRTIGAMKELAGLIGIEKAERIEAFDISNISGFANVGSMVVFEKGKAKRSDYRKFKMKSIEGPDDYGCMKEVLERRFLHGLKEKDELKQKELDETLGSFSKFPDLILMDGGKGQVHVCEQVLSELHIYVPVCGMVKDDRHRTRGLLYQNQEVEIEKHSEGFKLVTRIQDEAHRFAIDYHRALRSKGQVKSILDDIPGIGDARRKALMRHFSSLEDIKAASVEDFIKIEGFNRKAAENIIKFFKDMEKTVL
jgi:excinuclease ABC subunit C